MKKASLTCILALLVLCSPAAGLDPSKNMVRKWSYALPYTARGFTTADVNGDGSLEVIAGLHNNTLMVFNRDGTLKSANISIENVSEAGKIYALAAADFTGSGASDLIVGTGGLQVTETFNLYGFTVPNATSGGSAGGIVWAPKVLYRTVRYMGKVYRLNSTGSTLWKKPVYNSVLDLDVEDVYGNGDKSIIAGVGDYGLDVYSEEADINYTERTCETEEISDEPTGYDEEHCTCQGCVWHPDTEECLRSYVKTTCHDVVSTVPGRVLVDYVLRNGTAYIEDKNGNVLWKKDVTPLPEDPEEKMYGGEADHNVRVVYAADIDFDGKKEIFIGTDAGALYVYNISGLLLLKYTPTSKIVGGITAVYAFPSNKTSGASIIMGTNNGILAFFDVADMDSDGTKDIVVGCEDGNIYIYDSNGINTWYYPTGAPVYYLKPLDIDENGYMDAVVGSTFNVSLYEMNVDYVLRQSAGAFYDKAQGYADAADYTIAMIYATKAKDIYLQIRDSEGISRTDVLISEISDELKARKKFEADMLYDRAVAAYARNDANNSLLYLAAARAIYVDIRDTVGVNKCDSLNAEIDKFLLSEQALVAESHYVRALNYLSFRNYSSALDEARTARAIYEEIGYMNGTILANRVITGLADSYYSDSRLHLSLRNFNVSIEYAQMAFVLYNETRTYDGTAKTELLLQEISAKMAEPPPVELKITYMPVLYGIIGVLIVLVLLKLRKKRAGEKEFKSSGVRPEVRSEMPPETPPEAGVEEKHDF